MVLAVLLVATGGIFCFSLARAAGRADEKFKEINYNESNKGKEGDSTDRQGEEENKNEQ